jgi:hypothetical protein
MAIFSPDELRKFASLGAQLRLAELDRERESIFKNFPELAAGDMRADTRAIAAAKTPRTEPDDHEHSSGNGAARHRRPRTAAQRREMSERMTAYWAAKRRASKRRSATA